MDVILYDDGDIRIMYQGIIKGHHELLITRKSGRISFTIADNKYSNYTREQVEQEIADYLMNKEDSEKD